MEQDYNKNIWSKGCPNVDCRKSCSKCGIKYIDIPSALGDDHHGSPVAPKNGAYSNAVVYYEANGAVYIYSSEGVPVEVNISDARIMEEIHKLEEEKADKAETEAAITNLQNTKADKSEIPTKVSQLINDSGYLTSNSFTAEQWAAIDSGITMAAVSQINTNKTNITNLQTSKQDVITSSNKLNADLVDDTSATHKFATSAQLSQIATNSSNITNLQSTKQDITDNSLQTTSKTITGAINEVDSIAKGANQAISYSNYSAMVTAFNAAPDDEYNIGQNIYILTLDVPDLWVSSVETTSVPYTYTTDAAIISAIDTNGYIQIGYYKLSALETQEVDLTNYVTNTDYATSATAGVIKVNSSYGTDISNSGELKSTIVTSANYSTMEDDAFVSKGTLENAITSKGLVNNTDYATSSVGGVVKVASSNGVGVNSSNGNLYLSAATETDVDNKTSVYKPIVPARLDYATKIGVTTNTLTLTDTEKTNACSWLGTGKMVTLTQAQYDALVSGGTVDSNTYYFIIEE